MTLFAWPPLEPDKDRPEPCRISRDASALALYFASWALMLGAPLLALVTLVLFASPSRSGLFFVIILAVTLLLFLLGALSGWLATGILNHHKGRIAFAAAGAAVASALFALPLFFGQVIPLAVVLASLSLLVAISLLCPLLRSRHET